MRYVKWESVESVLQALKKDWQQKKQTLALTALPDILGRLRLASVREEEKQGAEIRVFEIGSDDDELTEEMIASLPKTESLPADVNHFVENSYWKPAYKLGYSTYQGADNTETVYLVKDTSQRIHEIRQQITKLSDELLALAAPTDEEKRELREDLSLNPDIYASYLEDDALFIAENVLDEREATHEHKWQEQPGEPPFDVCTSCGEIRR